MSELLCDAFERELRRLMSVWFPRTVDATCGGFLCDFDHRWRPTGPHCKMLEYQARQTLAAARAGAHLPGSAPLREAAMHGFRYLEERMWDAAHGGWYRALDRQGEPLEGGTKHGHGYAYAISACVACYRLTGDAGCLSLARAAFQWLDAQAHDADCGGYHVFYERDGRPILSADRAPETGQVFDPIGTPIGLKDANTNSDLLKCFAELYAVWPDALLGARLAELLRIVRDRLVVGPGVMHIFAHPDWTPLPELARYGQIIRSATILIAAAQALGESAGATTAVAGRMIDRMLEVAWDPRHGGFHLAGSAFGRSYIEDAVVYVPNKRWWVQADGMKALATLARHSRADARRYLDYLARLWRYIEDHLIDARAGGWFATGLDADRAARRWPKATKWKDVSHETEALLDCIANLRAPPTEPAAA